MDLPAGRQVFRINPVNLKILTIQIQTIMKHVSIKISGNVQGVFFRASTKEKADALGVTGFVRNEKDGSVYVEAEAEGETLKQFVAWCYHGPSRAEVKNVSLEEGGIQGFSKFEVKR
jgi:acylphosphatase